MTGFDRWHAELCARLTAEGIDIAPLAMVRPIAEVLARDAAQPEFSLLLRDYLEQVVTSGRVAQGRAMLDRHAALFERIEVRFGVPRTILAAIWGIETGYGASRGDVPLLAALATLAHDGRRRAFFEGELRAALWMIAKHGADPALLGSWAGASGHMQFMPSSVLAHAVDFDGDGRADLWADDPTDALASAAAYLAGNGWRAGGLVLTGARRRAPGFDAGLAGRDHAPRTIGAWRALGADAGEGRPEEEAALILPAGHRGPAFLWGGNAAALARYNASESYVIAVALLAGRLAGGTAPHLAWPEGDRAPGRVERREAQELLASLGHDPGAADGIVGPNTVRALREWQRRAGLVADGYLSAEMLEALKGKGRPRGRPF